MGNQQAIDFIFDDKNVLSLIKMVALRNFRFTVESMQDFMSRKIDIFRSTAYSDPQYTTTFFCVKGSPNKLSGFIKMEGDKFVIYNDRKKLTVKYSTIFNKD